MTRIMQDSDITDGFTDGADIYASYVLSDTGEGHNNYAATVARFPNAQHLSICTRFNASATCLDYENATTGTGPSNAQQAVAWTVRMRQQGRTPWNYCNQSTWPELIAAYAAAGVTEPIWWIANTSTGPVMIPGAVAHQYTFNEPANPYDTSIVADYIEGFDGLDPSGGGTPIVTPLGAHVFEVLTDGTGFYRTDWHSFWAWISAFNFVEIHISSPLNVNKDATGAGTYRTLDRGTLAVIRHSVVELGGHVNDAPGETW